MSRRRMMMFGVNKGGSRLPSEYQEVEWIGSGTGGGYINTEYIPNADTKARIKVKIKNTAESLNIAVVPNYGFTYDKSSNSYGTRFGYTSTTSSGVTPSINDFDEIELSKNGAIINGIDVPTNIYTSWKNNLELLLFKYAVDSIFGYTSGYVQIAEFKIWEGETLLIDFVPCYRKSDGHIGMFNLISETFFENAGSLSLEKGGDVN